MDQKVGLAIQVHILLKLFWDALLERANKSDKFIFLPLYATNSQFCLDTGAFSPVDNFNGNIDPFPAIIAADEKQPERFFESLPILIC